MAIVGCIVPQMWAFETAHIEGLGSTFKGLAVCSNGLEIWYVGGYKFQGLGRSKNCLFFGYPKYLGPY